MKSNFQESRNNRASRYARQAAKNQSKAESAFDNANAIGKNIPMGQPILIGHHSEKKHRKDLARIDNSMRAGIDAEKKSEYYKDRLDAMLSNTSISSDDPEALTKLKAKLQKLTEIQQFMKAANKCVRSGSKEKFLNLDFGTEALWIEIFESDPSDRGFPRYRLTNNNSNMGRIKQRLEQLEKFAGKKTNERLIKGVRVLENVEGNRIQLFFPGIPPEDVRKILKKTYSFKWSPREGAWQRFLNNGGIYAANNFLEQYQPKE